ncbi:MAG: FAD-binding protein, partial [Ornithinimicrobium sp.]
MTQPPLPHAVTEQQWSNWGGNQVCTPALTVRPQAEQEVVDAVRYAIHEGMTVRVAGTGHSFTPVVQTGGMLLDLSCLQQVTGVDSDTRRVRALGGTAIREFGEPLWEAGLSLSNQGDIDAQTIAGAISTGTHGSGIELGSFSSSVRWIKLVTGSGEVIEIDETDLRRLRAAQVAVGTLGVVLEVELQARPAYYLREQVTYETTDELLEHWASNP